MTVSDSINGIYELLGGLALAFNCYRTYKDKEIKGISVVSMVFFTSWGYWNLYFYPSLHQVVSTIGAVILVFFNTIWLCQALYYITHPKKQIILLNPNPNTVMENNNGNTVTVLEVGEGWIRGQHPDGSKFMRSRSGFMKSYHPKQ
jgi:hypothetical protein